MSRTERNALREIRAQYPRTLEEIAELLWRTKGWTYHEAALLVERLVHLGYLTRETCCPEERYVPVPTDEWKPEQGAG